VALKTAGAPCWPPNAAAAKPDEQRPHSLDRATTHAPAVQLTPVLADLNTAAEGHLAKLVPPILPRPERRRLAIELGSTNTELMERAAAKATDHPHPARLPSRQTAGRGRLGRHLASRTARRHPHLLTGPAPASGATSQGAASALSLAVGLAVADRPSTPLLRNCATLAPRPRSASSGPTTCGWQATQARRHPHRSQPTRPGLSPHGQRWVVIGVGLNVRPGTAPANSVSLADIDPASQPRLGEVWAWIAPALLSGVQAFARHGFAPLQDAYAQRDVLRDQSVGLWSTPGHAPADGHPPTQTGVAHGVDAQGALLVHTQQGVQAWHSGDISVRPHTA
jgi:BirA family biotin operon repressor/biotin-[acetyl-CoA-carboxylase] ligase